MNNTQTAMQIEMSTYAYDAEQATLACLMVDSEALKTVSKMLQPKDFGIVKHRRVYSTMLAMLDEGSPVEILGLDHKLRHLGHYDGPDKIDGAAYLVALGNATPHLSYGVFYAGLVKAAAIRREVMALTDHMRKRACDESITVEQLITDSIAALKAVEQSRPQTTPARSVAEGLTEQYDRVEQATENGVPKEIRYTFPLVALQHLTGGVPAGSVMIYAGRPASGKTSLMHNHIVHQAQIEYENRSDRRVLLYSREMPEQQVLDSIMSSYGRVDLQALSTGVLRPDDMRKYVAANAKLSQLPIDIDDKTAYWEDIAAEIMNRRRQGILSMVFIDYLKLIRTRTRFSGDSATRLRMEYIMTEAKQLAMDTQSVIVIAAQINRQGESAPTLANLKDSGATEEDSDVVLAIHRDSAQPTGVEVQEAQLLVLKNRHGAPGTVPAGFFGRYKLFVNVRQETIRPRE